MLEICSVYNKTSFTKQNHCHQNNLFSSWANLACLPRPCFVAVSLNKKLEKTKSYNIAFIFTLISEQNADEYLHVYFVYSHHSAILSRLSWQHSLVHLKEFFLLMLIMFIKCLLTSKNLRDEGGKDIDNVAFIQT